MRRIVWLIKDSGRRKHASTSSQCRVRAGTNFKYDGHTVSGAGLGWKSSDGTWELVAYDPPEPDPIPITTDMVDEERNRRIEAGFSFGGVLYQSRPDDRENIAGASTAALAAIMNGAQLGDFRWHGGDSDFVWIDAANDTHPMDAQTMFALGQAAMAHKQTLIFAARAIKDMMPIPDDYTDDQYWP